MLARVRNVDAARAWLRSAPVTTAVTLQPPPVTALQVAFTAAGLEALGVPAAVRAGFSPEFLGGMDDPSRARRLGDVGVECTLSDGTGATRRSCRTSLVMFFAKPGQLDGWVAR